MAAAESIETAPDQPFSPLVAQILTAQHELSRQISGNLTDSLMAQVADLNAELDAVRSRVMGLVCGDFMPTPVAIQKALYPNKETVARFREPEVAA